MKTYSSNGDIFLTREQLLKRKNENSLVPGAKYYILDDPTISDLISGLITVGKAEKDAEGNIIHAYYLSKNNPIEGNQNGRLIFPEYDEKGLVTGVSEEVQRKELNINGNSNFIIYVQNGSDITSLNFYVPENAGEKGQFLVSNGENQPPVWVNLLKSRIGDNETIKETENNESVILTTIGVKSELNNQILSGDELLEALTFTILDPDTEI